MPDGTIADPVVVSVPSVYAWCLIPEHIFPYKVNAFVSSHINRALYDAILEQTSRGNYFVFSFDRQNRSFLRETAGDGRNYVTRGNYGDNPVYIDPDRKDPDVITRYRDILQHLLDFDTD
jgi:hypothetical protein